MVFRAPSDGLFTLTWTFQRSYSVVPFLGVLRFLVRMLFERTRTGATLEGSGSGRIEGCVFLSLACELQTKHAKTCKTTIRGRSKSDSRTKLLLVDVVVAVTVEVPASLKVCIGRLSASRTKYVLSFDLSVAPDAGS